MNTSQSNAFRFYFDDMLRNGVPSDESIKQAKSVFNSLLEVNIEAIVTELARLNESIVISSSDIPQYSSLPDCFHFVDKFIRSGLDGISYPQAGFLLRTNQRKKGADCKYGENHAKCAGLMGLCRIEKGKIWRNSFSYAYEEQDYSMKESLMPKLCLGIKMVRGYFQHLGSDGFIQETMSCLSESTKKRRKPNIMRLIYTVKESIK